MNRVEVTKLLNRIKANWNYFNVAEYVVDEWLRLLKPYDNYDVNLKLDNYIKNDEKDQPPTAKYMASYLLTPQEKANKTTDILIDCNLCHKTMRLSEYNNTHFKKCLLIKTLIPILKRKGNDVTYEALNEYDYTVLDKLYEKYGSLKTIEDMRRLNEYERN